VAGWRTLHGLDPYSWTRQQVAGGASFPYPAPAALILAPFALISSIGAGILATAACVIAAPLALWILGIRDWRIYGAVALWAPVVIGWQTANFTLPLLVATALLWRCRDRPWAAAAIVAGIVSIKPIMAPLWVWLLLTRRWHAAASAVLLGIVLNAASWTVLGWHELGGWLSLLSLQDTLRDSTGYSLIALARHVGLQQQIGEALMVAFGCAAAGVAVLSIRSGRELRAFSAAVLLPIVISPQIDAHYFALLVVPLALTRPRLSWAWLAPLLLWACPATLAGGWQILLWWLLVAVVGREILMTGASPSSGETRRAAALGRRRARGAAQAGC
jgi:hypothetical protein